MVGVRSQDPGPEDGKTSSSGEYMTREDHEDAHFLAFVAHNTKAYGHDKGKWRRAPPCQGKELQNEKSPMSFTEYWQDIGGCWVCYGKERSCKLDHKMSKVYEEDGGAYFQTRPENIPKEKWIEEWKERQAGGS